jgi:gliding motility-associated-like protein
MRLKTYLVYFTLLVPNIFLGQISVAASSDISAIKNQLVGQSIDISNFRISAGAKQVGTFNDPLEIVGIGKGIILATGDIQIAEGPNDSGTESTANNGTQITDPLLDELANKIGVKYYDAAILEFDFVAKGNLISFKYVFASDEYIEDDADFPDFFGFWVTRDGDNTVTNIAKLPNSNIDVSTRTVNDIANAKFYNDNGNGSTPILNPFFGFDGYTDVFVAEFEVIPCKKYHLKMAIADASDQLKDSGVMIETQSFSSNQKPLINVSYQSRDSVVVEECASATVEVKHKQVALEEVNYTVKYQGSAGTQDFVNLPKQVVFLPNESLKSFVLNGIQDNLKENESIIIQLIPSCDTNFVSDKVEIPIIDSIEIKVPDFLFCQQTNSAQVNKFDQSKYQVSFEVSPNLSCSNCPNPTVFAFSTDTVTYSYKELGTSCSRTDSFKIGKFVPFVNYSLDTNIYQTSVDIEGSILNSNMSRFVWDIEDKQYFGKTILHFGPNLQQSDKCTPIKLTAFEDSLNCQVVLDTLFCNTNRLIVPNIITPNKDDKNDFFEPVGIKPGYWTLTIYNRYGKEVFLAEKYNFDFSGENLSEGTYFYELANIDRSRKIKGWLQIIR